MALPHETIHLGAANPCPQCGKKMKEQVLHSPAGFYIGTMCHCGPYSRESHYYETEAEADTALRTKTVNYREALYYG